MSSGRVVSSLVVLSIALVGCSPPATAPDAASTPDTGAPVDAGIDATSTLDAGPGHDGGSPLDAYGADADLGIDAPPASDAASTADGGWMGGTYEAPAAPVDRTTRHVATLPRPAHVTVPAPTACPHLAPGLTAWDPAWSVADGVVEIPAGAHVLLRGNLDLPATVRLRELHVPATSELIVDDRDATFVVTDLHVEGALRVGSPTCRLASHITFVLDTAEDVADGSVRDAIAARMGLGVMVDAGGQLDVFGRLYQPTWTRLGATADVGARTLVLAESVDWEPGQELVVVTSALRDYPYADENEIRTIASVTGNQVVLDRPLTFRHIGSDDYQVEVGLLGRSIVFRTSDAVRVAAPTFGGHVMISGGVARVSGVELDGLGQQNHIGRYPFHFHYALAGSSFTDSSVHGSAWRAVVVHRTNGAVVSRNVAFDVFGHAFYLEDGVETDNEISFNLAARIKIMGPTDTASLAVLATPTQVGITVDAAPDLVQPADRAAAGFYLSNGDNWIFGNAASGGFAGFSFPSLPAALGPTSSIVPVQSGITYFDGNSVHTSAYLWQFAGGVYIGGVLTQVDVGGVPQLVYQTGRTTDWNLLRHTGDVLNDTKTFLCTIGVSDWGSEIRLVNTESHDNELLAQLFGSASIQSAVVVGRTATPPTGPRLTGFTRGFQFYDTDTQTVLSDVVFRDFASVGGVRGVPNLDHCALFTMTHSDEYTPQFMNATQRLYFDRVDRAARFCLDDTGTLSSRNFNLFDADGSATALAGDGLPAGPRLVGSGFTTAWRLSPSCVRDAAWGLWLCPLTGAPDVAALNTMPNQGVRATLYALADGSALGDNWFSTSATYIDAQITAPSRTGWHHTFPGRVPDAFDVQVLQLADGSFVVYSFSLPAGVECSVSGAGWQHVADAAALLAASGSAYTTDRGTCLLRIEPTGAGVFQASGLSIPNQTWRGNPTPTTYFTVVTGCTASNPACASLVSTLPTLP